MSEYQYVAFQAVDRPLNDKQLEYAERQSTRAEVSRWALSVEYHYSSFRGDVDGLLRRGYDAYLQYTNFGDREIRLRLPQGMPVAKSVWSQYVDGEQLAWKKDTKGRGGILSLQPFREDGDLEQEWELQKYLDAAIQIRELLIGGDLRALYLLWLCAADDDYNDPAEMIEPPVPHGISDLETHGGELLSFFGLDPLLLLAAGQDVEAAPTDESKDHALNRWVQDLSAKRAKDLLVQMLSGDAASVKASLLSEARDSQILTNWPTTNMKRSFGGLLELTEALRSDEDAKQARKADAKAKREAAKADCQRKERMQQMVQDPKKWLREAEQLVEERGTDNYKTAAEILYDLREAVGGDKGEKITRRHAAHLTKKHPTLTHLKSSLRKRGLLE